MVYAWFMQALRVAHLPALVVLAHGDMAPRQEWTYPYP